MTMALTSLTVSPGGSAAPSGWQRSRRPIRRAVVLLGVVTTLSVAGVAAWAFFTNGGFGSSTAGTGSLIPPTNVVASAPIDSSTVAVAWTGTGLATGEAAPGYYVVRVRDADETTFPACGTTPSTPMPAVSCSDLGVTDGQYHYRVTAVFGSWTSVGAASTSVTVINDSSLPTVSVTSISPTPNGNGYNNSSPVVVNLAASAGLGIKSVTYAIDGQSPVTVLASTASISVSGDAIHTITYSARDNVDNQSEVGTVLVRIDTVAPIAASAPVLTTASDSGVSSVDAITKIASPTLVGSAEDGSTVSLFDGSTLVGSATATGGAYTILSGSLADGSHSLTVRATDIAGNLGPISGSTTITIDTTVPAAPSTPAMATASDTGASSTDNITKTTAPTFTGTGEIGATVGLFDGAIATGTAVTANGAGTFSAVTATLTSAVHTISAKTTDVAGNVSVASASVFVTIDAVVPTVTLNQAVGQADPTTVSPINFTVTFSEPVTGLTPAGITYTGTALATTSTLTGSGATYNIASSGMTKTGIVVPAIAASKAQDTAGNLNTAATFTDRTVTYTDTTPPAAPSTPFLTVASDSGASSADGITKVATPTYTGTAEIGSTVKLFDGVTQVGSVVATASTYSISSTTLTNGTHSITATATDSSLNVSVASAAVTVTIDTVLPTVAVNQAVGQADPTTISPINFTVTFSESVTGLTSAGVTYTGSTALPTTTTLTGSGATYNIATTGMTKTGTVIPAIAASKAQDTAGNLNTTATYTDHTVTYTDSAAPVVTISDFTAPGDLSHTANISGTAGIGLGDNLTVTVVLCTTNAYPCTAGNTKATLSGVAVNPTTGLWTVTSGPVGTTLILYARATQTDLTGNTGNSNIAGPILVP